MNLCKCYSKSSHRLLVALASIAALAMSSNVFSAQGTATMPIQLVIIGGCSIVSTSTMLFPTPVALEELNTTAQINIMCSNGIPFEIGIDAGAHSTNVAARVMQSATLGLVTYSIYKTGAHAAVWGNTQGVDTLVSAGDGYVQQFAAYGNIRVPTVIPAAGTYTDTVNVFVYF